MTFPYKKALVTGGAGFIGSHLVEALVEMGVETISLDNYSAGKHENLTHLVGRRNFKEIDCDVRDFISLKDRFGGVDIVFHNAATKKVASLFNPWRDLETNAKGTLNVLELSRRVGVRKFVHASTGSVYGEGRCFPQDEAHPLAPVSFYGVSKLAGEKYVSVFNHLYGLDTTMLRYFHVYGPRQDSSDYGGVVAIFIRRLLNGQAPIIFGDGTQQRSFTYVKDVVRANLHVATTPGTKGEVYNCASGIRVTINELAHSLIELLGREDLRPTYRDWQPGDIRVFDVDNAKLRAMGFEFQMPFEEGLKRTIESYANS